MQYRAWTGSVRTVAAGVACALCFGSARAETATVLGDSIGVGIAMAGGVPRLAHNSVTIRSGDALNQIGRLPPDSTAVLSLGTNDAVGDVGRAERSIDRGIDGILDALRRSGLHLVWVGPPCVRKAWNANVQKLDGILRNRLADKVAYVSVADPEICDRRLRAADGIHFTMQGYAVLWARASAALTSGERAARAGEPRRLAAAQSGR